MFLLSSTIKKKSPNSSLIRMQSHHDFPRPSELSLQDVRILLACHHSDDPSLTLSHRARKQEVLERNRLVNPARMFGLGWAESVRQSARNNSRRLNQMFEDGNVSINNNNISQNRKICKK
jgi:hypothetical protein